MGTATDKARAAMARIKDAQDEDERQKKEERRIRKETPKRKASKLDDSGNPKHRGLSKKGLLHYFKPKVRQNVSADFSFLDGSSAGEDVEAEILLRPNSINPTVNELVISYEVDEKKVTYSGGINPANPMKITASCKIPYNGMLVLQLAMLENKQLVLEGTWNDRWPDGTVSGGKCRFYID